MSSSATLLSSTEKHISSSLIASSCYHVSPAKQRPQSSINTSKSPSSVAVVGPTLRLPVTTKRDIVWRQNGGDLYLDLPTEIEQVIGSGNWLMGQSVVKVEVGL